MRVEKRSETVTYRVFDIVGALKVEFSEAEAREVVRQLNAEFGISYDAGMADRLAQAQREHRDEYNRAETIRNINRELVKENRRLKDWLTKISAHHMPDTQFTCGTPSAMAYRALNGEEAPK